MYTLPTLGERVEHLRQVYEMRQALAKQYGWPCATMDFFFFRKADRIFLKWLREVVCQDLYFFAKSYPHECHAFKVTDDVVEQFRKSHYDALIFIVPRDTPGDHKALIRPLFDAFRECNEREGETV